MSKVTEKAEMAGGLALIGGLVAGFAGLVAALVSLFTLNLLGSVFVSPQQESHSASASWQMRYGEIRSVEVASGFLNGVKPRLVQQIAPKLAG